METLEEITDEVFSPLGRLQLVPVPESCPPEWLYGNMTVQ